MTTSLSVNALEEPNTDTKSDEILRETQENKDDLFSRFQVSNEFPAHKNLVLKVLEIFKHQYKVNKEMKFVHHLLHIHL